MVPVEGGALSKCCLIGGFGHKGVVLEDEDVKSVFLYSRQGQILRFHFIMAFWQSADTDIIYS